MATPKIAQAPMKAGQVSRPGGEFAVVQREIFEPIAGQVRIKVQACEVCYSDVLTKGPAAENSVSSREPQKRITACGG